MNCKNCENYHSCKLTKGKTIIDCKYFVSKDDKYIRISDDKYKDNANLAASIVKIIEEYEPTPENIKTVAETGTNEC